MRLVYLLLGVIQVQLISFLIQDIELELFSHVGKQRGCCQTAQRFERFYSFGAYKSSCEGKNDFLEDVVSNLIATRKYLGWEASKNSETSQDKVEYHKYLGGREVMKAINGNDVLYTDKKGKPIEVRKRSTLKKVHNRVDC